MTQPPSTWDLLKGASNEDLEPLVGYIKNATTTEWLTISDEYKANCPNHTKYVSKIYDEICLFGGNTLANMTRGGRGPGYQEVLGDAAKKVGVKHIDSKSVLELEQAMLECILRKALEKAKSDGDNELLRKLHDEGISNKDYSAFLSGGALATLLTAAVYRGVIARLSATVAEIVAQQVLRSTVTAGASFVAERAGALFFGPVGLVVAGLWTAVDIAGPAFRVTVPCTLHIAMLRQKWLCEQAAGPLRDAFND